MIRFSLLLIFISNLLFSSGLDFYKVMFDEYEPSNIFDDSVNVISGNYIFDNEIKVLAKEPIQLKIHYMNLQNFDIRSKDEKNHEEYVQSGWSFYDSLKAYYYGDRLDILENGNVHSFSVDNFQEFEKGLFETKKNKKLRKESEKLEKEKVQCLSYLITTNLSLYSTKNNKNDLLDPKDLKVILNGQYELLVMYPDGSEKFYQRDKDGRKPFLLKKHTLSNANIIHYSYDSYDNLIQIKTTNPNSDKIYGWINFSYSHPDPNYNEKYSDKKNFSITTSDDQKYFFIYDNYYPIISKKEKSLHPFFILKNINTNQIPLNFEYHLDFKKTHPLLKQINFPNNKKRYVDFYLLGNKNPEVGITIEDNQDLRFERVKTVRYLTNNKDFDVSYKFIYDPGIFTRKEGSTKIVDSDNNMIIYHYNQDFKITKIQKYKFENNQHILSSQMLFTWEKNGDFSLLIAKVCLDENNNCVFAKKYSYDNKSRVVEEKTFGNISSKYEFVSLDSSYIPKDSSEHFTKRYSYFSDNIRLVNEEIDDSSVKIKYCYFENTSLLSKKLTYFNSKIKKREFFFYNDDDILVKEIEDDGTEENFDNLKNVTTRKIKNYFIKNSDQFIGMVEELHQKYLDLETFEEKMISKEKYFYSNVGKISKIDFFDKDDNFLFSKNYEYDVRKNQISYTDPIGRKFFFDYDKNNNLIYEKDFSLNETFYTYDPNENLVTKKIAHKNFDKKTSYFYDKNGNNISYVDELGNTHHFFYGAFNKLIGKKLPKIVNDEIKYLQINYESDSLGRKGSETVNGNTTFTSFNIFNKPTNIKYPDGTEEKFTYNLDGTLNTFIDKKQNSHFYEYDFLKRIASKKIYSKSGKILKNDIYKYNLYGLIEKLENSIKTKYVYDYSAKLKKEIIENNDKIQKKEFFYDALQRVCTVKQGSAIEITKKDFLGRIFSEEKLDDNNHLYYKKEYNFDKFDNVEVLTYLDDNTSVEKKFFDFEKNLIKKVDAFDNVTTYDTFIENSFIPNINLYKIVEVNPINQTIITLKDIYGNVHLIQKINKDGIVFYNEKNTFDINQNIISKDIFFSEKEKNKMIFFKYDHLNRLISKKEKNTNQVKETQFRYDDFGNLKTIIKPDTIEIENEYDELSRLSKISASDGSISYCFEYNQLNLPTIIHNFIDNSTTIRKYDSVGNLIEEKLSNNLTIKKEYDASNRVIKITYPDTSYTEYVYDAFTLREVFRKTPIGETLYTHRYKKYDLSLNLLEEELMGDLGMTYYDRDKEGRLTLIETPFGIQKVEKYDALGRINKLKWKIFWGSETSSFAYNDFNQVVNETGLFENYKSDNIKANLSFDENENIIEKKDIDKSSKYTYDALDRLIKVETNDEIVSFSYDGLNRKIQKDVFDIQNSKNIVHINYLYDDYEEIAAYGDKTPFELKVLGLKTKNGYKAVAFELKKDIYAPLYDNFGSVSSLISINQGLVESYRYSASGENLICTSSGKVRKYSQFANPWQYLEKRVDDDINMLYLDDKFYDPIQKKYLNPAPLSIFLKNPLNNVTFQTLEGETNILNNEIIKEDIISFELKLDRLFDSFPFFSDPSKNITLKFSKETYQNIMSKDITPQMIIEALKRPVNIDYKNNNFIVFGKNIEVEVNYDNNEIISVKRLLN
ncbi:MAG: RHS repeat protein [Parachlamydiales bacterium]|nr:RHS repeat protein [Parachlamydiales bacterium]